jgi:hypothetical protein
MTQPLSRILLKGKQWAVTTYGLEALDGTYATPKGRLGESDWFEHMSRKTWVDVADFEAMLTEARRIHGIPPKENPAD